MLQPLGPRTRQIFPVSVPIVMVFLLREHLIRLYVMRVDKNVCIGPNYM